LHLQKCLDFKKVFSGILNASNQWLYPGTPKSNKEIRNSSLGQNKKAQKEIRFYLQL
jgi:hypothetical protein